MKKKVIIASVFSVSLLLGACQSASSQSEFSSEPEGDVSIFKDPSNGCQYIVYDGYKSGAMIQRMNADGTQMCGE